MTRKPGDPDSDRPGEVRKVKTASKSHRWTSGTEKWWGGGGDLLRWAGNHEGLEGERPFVIGAFFQKGKGENGEQRLVPVVVPVAPGKVGCFRRKKCHMFTM